MPVTRENRAAQRAERERRKEAYEARISAEDAEIAHALRLTEQLPEPLGEAITELFAAVQPTWMDDEYLSYPVIGSRSPELVKLARAVVSALK